MLIAVYVVLSDAMVEQDSNDHCKLDLNWELGGFPLSQNCVPARLMPSCAGSRSWAIHFHAARVDDHNILLQLAAHLFFNDHTSPWESSTHPSLP